MIANAPGGPYVLDELGGTGTQELRVATAAGDRGADPRTVIDVLVDRTQYLHDVLPCVESRDALAQMGLAREMWQATLRNTRTVGAGVEVLDPGHHYVLTTTGHGAQELLFVKRSGGAITYTDEHPGLQTQEVLRALIEHTAYESMGQQEQRLDMAADWLREALYAYEVRAWRRRQQGKNRQRPGHDDEWAPRPYREYPYADVPFSAVCIELHPVGADGHIVLETTAAAVPSP